MTTYSITIEPNSKDIVAALSAESGVSQQQIKHAMTCGAVWLERKTQKRRIRRTSANVLAGDLVTLHYNPDVLASLPIEPELYYHDEHHSVWIKPRGMTMTGSRFGDHTSLIRLTELHNPGNYNIYLVHRLDRFTEGLVIVAHNKRSAADLARQFRNRTVKKVYQAVVHGCVANQTVDAEIDGRKALSHVRVIDQTEKYSRVAVQIETGRKHQVRRHLAGLGHPIIGDRQYGKGLTEGDLQLLAATIEYHHPESGRRLQHTLDRQLALASR